MPSTAAMLVVAPAASAACSEMMACFEREQEVAGNTGAMFAGTEESEMSAERKAGQKKMDEGLSADCTSYLNGTTPAGGANVGDEGGQASSTVETEANCGCIGAGNVEQSTTLAGGANEVGRAGAVATTAVAAQRGGGSVGGADPLRGCLDGLLESACAEDSAAQQPTWGPTTGFRHRDMLKALSRPPSEGGPVTSALLPMDVEFLFTQLLLVRFRNEANANEAHMEEGQASDDDSASSSSETTSNGRVSDAFPRPRTFPRMPAGH